MYQYNVCVFVGLALNNIGDTTSSSSNAPNLPNFHIGLPTVPPTVPAQNVPRARLTRAQSNALTVERLQQAAEGIMPDVSLHQCQSMEESMNSFVKTIKDTRLYFCQVCFEVKFQATIPYQNATVNAQVCKGCHAEVVKGLVPFFSAQNNMDPLHAPSVQAGIDFAALPILSEIEQMLIA